MCCTSTLYNEPTLVALYNGPKLIVLVVLYNEPTCCSKVQVHFSCVIQCAQCVNGFRSVETSSDALRQRVVRFTLFSFFSPHIFERLYFSFFSTYIFERFYFSFYKKARSHSLAALSTSTASSGRVDRRRATHVKFFSCQ